MYRARYPDFDSSGRLDRALRVLVVASIAVLLGTVVGGASVFAIVSALNTPPRHEARADSRTASEAALAGGPVIKRLSPNSAAAASPAPAPDASTATSTTPVQPETPPLQATRPGLAEPQGRRKNAPVAQPSQTSSEALSASHGMDGIQETPKPRDSTAPQAVDSTIANNRADRSSRNWEAGQRRAIVTARPAGPSASANRRVPPREAVSNEIGARAAAASQTRSLWNYSGRDEYWREGQAKEATHSMARRVSRKVPSQPEYAERYDGRAEPKSWEARDPWRGLVRWGDDQSGGDFFGRDNWRNGSYE